MKIFLTKQVSLISKYSAIYNVWEDNVLYEVD